MVPKPIIVTTPPPSSPSLSSPPLPLLNNISTSIKTQDKPQLQTQTIKTKPQTPPTPTPSNNNNYKKQAAVVIKRRSPPPPQQLSIPSLLFNTLDDIINNFIDPPKKPSVDPRHVLSQNFAPVDELPPTECETVEGTLPPCLEGGAYIRNGPNPQFLPKGPYHLFDGDGMLHCIKISNSKATLCSRYVKTYKYHIENQAGHSLIPNVFSGFNSLVASAARGSLTAARVFAGEYNPVNGIGLANTSLALFGGNLLALGESDLPYKVRVTSEGDIETICRHDFDGKLFMSMTAHPKVDNETGEVFAFRYGPVPPFLTYFYFDSEGRKKGDVAVFSMTKPSFIHDFAITKKYAVFADIQIGMNPIEMISGGSPIGSDPSKVPRLGFLPRYATDESNIKWIDVPGFNIIHAINAWDEDDGKTITLIAPNILSVEHTLERLELVHALVEKLRINLDTGIVTRQPLSAKNLDFGVINPSYVGKKTRFFYAAIGDPMPKISGVVKVDLMKGEEVGCRMYGEGCYGGEPFFVANNNNNGGEQEEDDGYLLSYVHDEKKGESKFLVMDAKSPELDIVAAVKLPRRVPYGFHGLFVKDSDLRKVSVS